MTGKIAVFLDRDGVLNEAIVREGRPYPPKNIEEFIIRQDAYVVLEQLKQAGYYLFVVTNQPDVARGSTTREQVMQLNTTLASALPMIDKIYNCFHDDMDRCDCRKPAPGLLLQAQREYDLNLPKSFMIGDRWRDIEAGRAVGCKTVWLNFDYQEAQPKVFDYVTVSLKEAGEFILRRTHEV
jgi:D-glycero-D-manno-heptose 1,7-bisphosphate phosphatase